MFDKSCQFRFDFLGRPPAAAPLQGARNESSPGPRRPRAAPWKRLDASQSAARRRRGAQPAARRDRRAVCDCPRLAGGCSAHGGTGNRHPKRFDGGGDRLCGGPADRRIHGAPQRFHGGHSHCHRGLGRRDQHGEDPLRPGHHGVPRPVRAAVQPLPHGPENRRHGAADGLLLAPRAQEPQRHGILHRTHADPHPQPDARRRRPPRGTTTARRPARPVPPSKPACTRSSPCSRSSATTRSGMP